MQRMLVLVVVAAVAAAVVAAVDGQTCIGHPKCISLVRNAGKLVQRLEKKVVAAVAA